MKQLLTIIVLIIGASQVAVAASSLTILKQPTAITPYWTAAGMSNGTQVTVLTRSDVTGNEGLCQVLSTGNPVMWTDIKAPVLTTDMKCFGSSESFTGSTYVAGERRDLGGAPRAFVGDIAGWYLMPPFPGASRDNSRATDTFKPPNTTGMITAGWSVRSDGDVHAFLWDERTPGEILDLGCAVGASCDESRAHAIADERFPGFGIQVAGSTVWSAGLKYRRAAFYDGWKFYTVPQAHPGDSEGEALDINRSGIVMVGYSGKRDAAGGYDEIAPAVWTGGKNSWGAVALPEPNPAWCEDPTELDENRAYAVSFDGKAVWGGSYCGRGFISIIHCEECSPGWVSPPVDVKQTLLDAGVDLTGVAEINAITGIEASNFYTTGEVVITGIGTDPLGHEFGFEGVVDFLPEPGSGLGLIAGAGLLFSLGRKQYNPRQPRVDPRSDR